MATGEEVDEEDHLSETGKEGVTAGLEGVTGTHTKID